MQNNKYIYVIIGMLLIILSSVKFYTEFPPQNSFLLRLYCNLHGYDIEEYFDNGGWYSSEKYTYTTGEVVGNYYYLIDSISFEKNLTKIRVQVKPVPENEFLDATIIDSVDGQNILNNSSDETTNTPFADPYIRKDSRSYDNLYMLVRKQVVVKDDGFEQFDLFFPEFHRGYGSLEIYSSYKDSQRIAKLRSPNGNTRLYGSPVWFYLFIFGFIVFAYGCRLNYHRSIQKQLDQSLKKLDTLKNDALTSISRGNSYSSLSMKDKYRYDSAVSFLNTSQATIGNLYSRNVSHFNSSYITILRFFLWVVVMFLFLIVSITILNILFPELSNVFDRMVHGNEVHSSQAAYQFRISSLERSKNDLRLILMGLFVFGFFSIFVNYILSLAYSIYVIKHEVSGMLGKAFENILKSSSNSSVEVENRINSINGRIDSLDVDMKLTFHDMKKISSKYRQQFAQVTSLNKIKFIKFLRKIDKFT